MMPPDNTPVPIIPFYRRRWFAWTIGGVSLLIVSVIVAVCVVFSAWRSSPELALLDALQYAVKTPGVYRVTSDDVNATVVLRDKQYKLSGTVQNVPLDAILGDGKLYVKSSAPDKLYQLLLGASEQADVVQSMVQAVAPTVKDQWIVINIKGSGLQSQQTKATDCFTQAMSSVASKPESWSRVYGVYSAHRFVQADAASREATYDVVIDGTKMADFMSAIQQTDIYRSLGCTSAPSVGSFRDKLLRATVTLRPSERILQSISVDQGKNSIDITAEYSDVPTIAAPMNAIGIEQLLLRGLRSAGGLQQLFGAGS